MTTDGRPLLQVAAGIVYNGGGGCLLASRPQGKAYAGYWEFPGGKVEAGESHLAALRREFREELGIEIAYAQPWLAKVHDYEHARVCLRFFRVPADGWSGEIQAREGQQWVWQTPGAYTVAPMLPANRALLQALTVPHTLSGSLSRGFDDGRGYRVVSYAQSEAPHRRLLLSQADLARLGRLPEAESVWIAVENLAEWRAAQDADVVVWRVNGAEAAETVCCVLREGTPLPLVVAADAPTAQAFAAQWQELGAHAVVAEGGIGLC